MRHRCGKALRRRYGRTWGPTSAITRPVAGGKYDVIVVDAHGLELRALARGVPYDLAKSIIKRRHG